MRRPRRGARSERSIRPLVRAALTPSLAALTLAWGAWSGSSRIRLAPGASAQRPAVPAPDLAAPAPDLAAQELPEREAVETLRIGGLDAPEHAAFAREPDLVAAADGTMFVRISSPPSVVVFAPDGSHVRTIGGEGEGPGEFRVAAGHGLLGDTLWVLNFPDPKVSTFLLDGTHLETRRLEVIDHGRPFTAPQSVTALLEGPHAIAVPTGTPIGIEERARVPVLLGDRTLANPRSVLEVARPPGMFIRGVGSFVLAPLPIPPLISVAGNGIGFATAEWEASDAGTVRIARRDPDGDVLWELDLELPSPHVPASVRDSLIARGIEMAEPHVDRARSTGAVPRASTEELVRDGLHIPDRYPPVADLLLGRDGSVWLARDLGRVTVTWIVLDPSGEPSFRVELPRALRLRDATLVTSWGTILGELDIPYTVRLDLR